MNRGKIASPNFSTATEMIAATKEIVITMTSASREKFVQRTVIPNLGHSNKRMSIAAKLTSSTKNVVEIKSFTDGKFFKRPQH